MSRHHILSNHHNMTNIFYSCSSTQIAHQNILDTIPTKNARRDFARHVFFPTNHYLRLLQNHFLPQFYFHDLSFPHSVNNLALKRYHHIIIIYKAQWTIIQNIFTFKQNNQQLCKQQLFTSNRLFQRTLNHTYQYLPKTSPSRPTIQVKLPCYSLFCTKRLVFLRR